MMKAIKNYGLRGYYSVYFDVSDDRYFHSMYRSEIMKFFCTNQYQLYSNLERENLEATDKDFLTMYLTYNL